MKEFLTRIRDRKFDVNDLSDDFLKDLKKHKRYVTVEWSDDNAQQSVRGVPSIKQENRPISIKLSSRGYKIVGRRKLFQ